MNLHGILLGLAAFACIGVFHPIVVKAEYYFSWKIWPVFLVIGLVALTGSVLVEDSLVSSLLGVFGFSCMWSILELRHQKCRVEKGWFPANPKHSKKS